MKFCRLPDDALDTAQPVFRNAFGHEISSRMLLWKYADGRGESWLVCGDDDQPLCHGGVIYRPVVMAGECFRASHIVDVAAMPKRSGLNRQNSAYPNLLSYLSRQAWQPGNEIGFTFGFLSDRATRLGDYLGVLHKVDTFVNLRFPSGSSPFFGPVCHEVNHLPEAEVFKRLWATMSRGLDGMTFGARDLPYFSWRFVEHPEFVYRFIELKSFLRRRTIGLAIVRVDGEICQLSDIVAPLDDLPEILPALAAWSTQQRCKELHFSLTGRFARSLSPLALECNPLGVSITVSSLMPKDKVDLIHEAFWLTAGDTDYR